MKVTFKTDLDMKTKLEQMRNSLNSIDPISIRFNDCIGYWYFKALDAFRQSVYYFETDNFSLFDICANNFDCCIANMYDEI